MSSRAWGRALSGVCAVIWTGVAVPALAQSWHEHYARGEEALKTRVWREAIEELIRAIEIRPQSERDYYPYLKLGIAYYNAGQFEAALEVFDIELEQGQIAGSTSDLQNLNTFHTLALRAVMAEVGRALAADPKNAQANLAMERLRARLAELERQKELDQRVERLREEGQRLLASADYEEASSRFRQALSLQPGPELQGLLDESLQKLRAAVQARTDAEQQRRSIQEGLEEAARLDSRGNPDEALSRLETVLALEPNNPQARSLQTRLLREREVAERELAQSRQIAALLEEAESLIEKRHIEQGIVRLQLVMALDPENTAAAERLEWALGFLERQPTEPGTAAGVATKLPPAVALLNAANPADGTAPERDVATERVSAPELVLAGMILDDQPELDVAYLRDEAGEFRTVSEERLSGQKTSQDLYRFSFSRLLQLDPGPSTWKVVATDADGLSGEVVHHVQYLRPWFRSPWLQAGLLATLPCGIAAYVGYRTHRRNRLLRRQFNPYQAGAPVLGQDLFFGRSQLMARVLQRIHNNSLLLYGERRIGKTSFQYQLKRRLQELNDPDFEFFPVYIDLEGVQQESFFATISHEILEELGPILPAELRQRSPGDDAAYGYRGFVRDVRDVILALRQRTSKRVKLTLLIDEVDELNAYEPRINQSLRGLFMKSFAEELVAVVTGVAIKKHWASEGSPWYNFFQEIEVRPFSREDGEELIRRPIAGIFTLEDGVVNRILDATECKPYLIQKTCVELVNHIHERKRRRITLGDVDAVLASSEAP